MTSPSRTPRTDAAWAECVRQGGPYEPFHMPLIDTCRQLEIELSQSRDDALEVRQALRILVNSVQEVKSGTGYFDETLNTVGQLALDNACKALDEHALKGKPTLKGD